MPKKINYFKFSSLFFTESVFGNLPSLLQAEAEFLDIIARTGLSSWLKLLHPNAQTYYHICYLHRLRLIMQQSKG
jgi:hypothetical protein